MLLFRRSPIHTFVASALVAAALEVPTASRAATDAGFLKGALAEGVFGNFVALIRKAGLEDKLGSGPVTVFMPTDGAFRRLPAKQRDALLALSPDLARLFVEHNVVPGVALTSKDLPKSVTTTDGTAFDLAWRPGHLTLHEAGAPRGKVATFVDGDVRSGRALIHGIDTVLLPATVKAEVDRVAAGGSAAAPSSGAAEASPKPAEAPAPASAPASPPAPPPATEATPVAAVPTASPAAPVASASPADSGGPAPSAGTPSATVAPENPPAPDKSAPDTSAPATPNPARAAPAAPTGANSMASAPAAANFGVPVAPAAPEPKAPPAVAPPAAPEVRVSTRDLTGWRVRLSDNKTGSVDRIVLGLPSGRVLGIFARFNAILGFGGKRAFIPWSNVTPDAQAHVLQVGMSLAEVSAAPK